MLWINVRTLALCQQIVNYLQTSIDKKHQRKFIYSDGEDHDNASNPVIADITTDEDDAHSSDPEESVVQLSDLPPITSNIPESREHDQPNDTDTAAPITWLTDGGYRVAQNKSRLFVDTRCGKREYSLIQLGTRSIGFSSLLL